MYKREFRSDLKAKWICAPDEFLKKYDRPRAEEFGDAKFIWGRRYTRAYFRRIFNIEGTVTSAFIRILCDNCADIFINGIPVSSERRDSGRVDITEHLVTGENLLMLRAYQTASPDTFTSALTGGIHIEYAEKPAEDIVTDGNFENIRFIDFWENGEPLGWETDKDINFEVNKQLVVTDMHAIAIKRSCFLRKEFTVSGKVKRATLSASALGCYEPHLNGDRVEEVYFLPSAADRVKEYQSFDVTLRINDGKNVLSALLGNGWYNCESWGNLLARKPALIMELTLEYADGRCEVIGTDESWLLGASPLIDNDLQFGERYDASLEVAGWDGTECDCTELCPASVLEKPPFDRLLLQSYPPIRTARRLPVTFVGELPDGAYLYDCGINIAGAAEITLRNTKPGQKIFISTCERLDESGAPELGAFTAPYFPKDSLPDGKAPFNLRNFNLYITKGARTEYYSPRFSYTGFRYIYIKGTDNAPDDADICAREMHTDLTEAGSFKSQDATLNRFFEAVKQTWLNNCYNGPTDCPTREKNFWTGDTMIFSHLACFLTDCREFLARWTDLGRKMDGPYGWNDELYMLPWTLYRFYGDPTLLELKYADICDFVNERLKTCGEDLLPIDPFSCYNDWLNPTGENLTPTFFSHCWFLRMLKMVSEIAGVLGDTEGQSALLDRFERAKVRFNEMHYDFEAGEYRERIQSSAVLPLAFGLVPDGEKSRVADSLHRRLAENGFSLTTGFQASRYILHVLTDNGYAEDAVKLIYQKEFPSWLYMLDTGATNICETWLAMNDPDKSVSMCHFSLGGAFAWFFEQLGGINIDECASGFDRAVLEPHCFEAFGGVSVRYMTPHGEITSEWHFEDGELKWNYTVPDGVEAEIRPPHIYKKT